MSKEENRREIKEKIQPPSDKVGKKGEDKNVEVKTSTKESPTKVAIALKPGVKRPSPGTSFSFGNKKKQSGISIQLQSQNKKVTESKLVPKLGAAAEAFNDESDEEEEMPLEAKLRMKNIGKDTPTASGPNSFGKTSQGFTNERRVWDMKFIDEARAPST